MFGNNITLISFSIGSALLFLLLFLMNFIFKQNYLKSFMLIYFFVFIANISQLLYLNSNINIFLSLSLYLTIISSYFLYKGTKQLYQLQMHRNQLVYFISSLFLIAILSFFPNTEFMVGMLFFIGILLFYLFSTRLFYQHGLKEEKSMTFLLILMVTLMIIKPFVLENDQVNTYISLVQGYLGLILAIALISIHLLRVKNQHQEQEIELNYLIHHDTLTGIYNRTYLNQLITNQTLEKQCPIVVVMMDMNNLKNINDTYGHDTGDHAIYSFAKAIESAKRQTDILIRQSGDEFLLFLLNTEENQAKEIIQKIKEQANSVSIGDTFLSISMGYAVMKDQNQDLIETIKRADEAMYRQKKSSKSAKN